MFIDVLERIEDAERSGHCFWREQSIARNASYRQAVFVASPAVYGLLSMSSLTQVENGRARQMRRKAACPMPILF
jgi:hypothetical protein